MKKNLSIRKRIARIFCGTLAIVFLLLIGSVLIIGKTSFSFSTNKFTSNDYSSIMKNSITTNPRAVDIAMLGAHDAFSNNINSNSKVDPSESADSMLNNNIVKVFADGLFVKLAKAQRSDAYDLLKHGVRYLDVRVTYADEWYTVHGLLSDKLENYLLQTIKFLSENKGEFVVFDIQHINLGSNTFSDFFDYLKSVKYNNTSLLDLVTYNPYNIPLGELRYNDITQGDKGGIVILIKADQYDRCYHYKYADSIRSVWHEKNTHNGILTGISGEYNTLKEDTNLARDKFRVNQAQMTGLFSTDVIFNTLKGWSLIDMAANFNPVLVAHENFEEWLSVMPIFMVDYSDSQKNGFNDTVIAQINLFNSAL